MKLYLLRHGEALPSTTNPQRPLSDYGIDQAKSIAKQLQAEDTQPQHVYHSGILRAQQTAEIIAEILNIPTVEKITGLLPEDSPELIASQIATWSEDTLLVGHLPYLSYLLLALSQEGDYVHFETATAVCVEKFQTKWQLQAVWNP